MIFQNCFNLLNLNIQSQKQTRNCLVKILLKVNLSVVLLDFLQALLLKYPIYCSIGFLYRAAHPPVEMCSQQHG